MKKEIKALWVKALKSGKYKKGIQQLKTDKGYCCLGVLTDLYINKTGYKKGWDGKLAHATDAQLPKKVMKWAGLKEADPKVEFKSRKLDSDAMGNSDGSNRRTLSVINDKTKKNFSQIADIIKAQL